MAFRKHRIEILLMGFTIVTIFITARFNLVDSIPIDVETTSSEEDTEIRDEIIVCSNMIIAAEWKFLRQDIKEYCVDLLIGKEKEANVDMTDEARSLIMKRTKSASNPNKKLRFG